MRCDLFLCASLKRTTWVCTSTRRWPLIKGTLWSLWDFCFFFLAFSRALTIFFYIQFLLLLFVLWFFSLVLLVSVFFIPIKTFSWSNAILSGRTSYAIAVRLCLWWNKVFTAHLMESEEKKHARTIIVSNKIPITFLFAHRLRHNDDVKSHQKCVFNENIMDWVNDKRALIAPSKLNIVVEIVVIKKRKTRIPIQIHLH